MPELPEVQTIVSDLSKKIVGETITGFWSDWPKAIKNVSLKIFRKNIQGRKVVNVRRIGKNIFIGLSEKKTIYIHLKMTGHLLVKTKIPASNSKNSYFNERVNQYIHHIFYLGEDKSIDFSDLRKFGKIILEDTDKIAQIKEIKELGIDVKDKNFTPQKLELILNKKKNKKIRDILMDQSIMAGIGNIYASEILYSAGILPTRIAKNIKSREIKKIYDSIQNILKKAIKLRGTSDSDYRDTSGKPGNFQKALKVYRRTGEKCQRCGTIIKRIKMGQRSAFYCPKCQS